jgi:hypothetical protein
LLKPPVRCYIPRFAPVFSTRTCYGAVVHWRYATSEFDQ